MGPGRNLRVLAEQARVSYGSVRNHAADFDWSDRIAQWEAYTQRAEDAERLAQIRQRREKLIDAAAARAAGMHQLAERCRVNALKAAAEMPGKDAGQLAVMAARQAGSDTGLYLDATGPVLAPLIQVNTTAQAAAIGEEWEQIRAAIVGALADHPDAMDAVADALDQLDQGGGGDKP